MSRLNLPLKVLVLIGLLALVSLPVQFLQAQMIPAPVRTTSSEIAIGNLQSQISSARESINRDPDNLELQAQLYDLISTRSQFLGSYFDFREMKKIADQQPETLEGYLLKAQYLATVHQFSEAEEMLLKVEAIDPNSQELRRQRTRIATATRKNLATHSEDLEQVLRRSRNYADLLVMAGVQAELGKYDEADAYFVEALSQYHDVSPFPVAFIHFQRGVMWGEKAGDDQRAKDLYAQALFHLPEYVVAIVHHGELLHESGDTQQAIDSLRRVISSTDPEPKGLLAELLEASGQPEEVEALVSRATADYDTLLTEFPLAFADHGSEFFSGPGGNHERGYALALRNLSNRRNERAFIVALEAATESEIPRDEFCNLALDAKSIQPVYQPLLELIADATDCAP